MKAHNRQTGILAENLAAEELAKKGYSILERNFSNRYGEIDIIAKDKEMLIFVEVKAKRGIEFGTPEEMITAYKLKRVQNMATIYMKGKNLPCRIDVVAIVFSPDNKILSLTHYKNVYF
ncbi:MAG: YraN family protein [Candidatus Levyibacteriota bacterium]|nr:MAG: YraN family protein [Candidatus Levybacteria bacterium]